MTDSAGFPLIDVWQKSSCFHTTWVLESYGRTVLLLHSVGKSWKLWANKVRKSVPVLEVESADGELLGYFVVGKSTFFSRSGTFFWNSEEGDFYEIEVLKNYYNPINRSVEFIKNIEIKSGRYSPNANFSLLELQISTGIPLPCENFFYKKLLQPN